jgi:hypothetical protein
LWGPTHFFLQDLPGILSSGMKRQGGEADHSPLSSAKVKDGGAISLLPHTSSRPGV